MKTIENKTERLYIITLEKKIIDTREISSGKINEILKLIDNVGFYVWHDDGIDPNELNSVFLKTRNRSSARARYNVSTFGPAEAIKKVLKEQDEGKDEEKKPIKSGALAISLDRIIELPVCDFLKEDDNGIFICASESKNALCMVERLYLHSCILAKKGDDGIWKKSSVVNFSEEEIEVGKQIFKVLRSKSS